MAEPAPPMSTAASGSSGTAPAPRVPEEWVPPDRRILGFDKRTLGPGIALLVIWFVWAHVTPWINDQIELDDPIVAGDVLNLDNGELVFVPAVGWNLEEGQRVTDQIVQPQPQTVVLTSEGVVYIARSAAWDGTSEELLDQMLDIDDRRGLLGADDERGRSTIDNADGVEGRLAWVVGEDVGVLFATYVFETSAGASIGVEIEVTATPDDIRDNAEEIARMIDSTTYRPDAEEAN